MIYYVNLQKLSRFPWKVNDKNRLNHETDAMITRKKSKNNIIVKNKYKTLKTQQKKILKFLALKGV